MILTCSLSVWLGLCQLRDKGVLMVVGLYKHFEASLFVGDLGRQLYIKLATLLDTDKVCRIGCSPCVRAGRS